MGRSTTGRVIRFSDEERVTVIDMASKGKSDFDISQVLGVTKRMLQYRCGTELKIGHKKAIEDGVNLPQVGKMKGNEGRIEFSPETRFQIGEMAGLGLKNDQIALILGVGKQTLVAYCQDDIDKGRARAHETVTKTLFKMATDGEHPNETKFYLKAQCGWKEATQVEFPDKDGNPQPLGGPAVQINLSADKMQTLIAILNDQV